MSQPTHTDQLMVVETDASPDDKPKRKKPADYTAEDYSHMRKVAAYVKRHGAQRPEGDQRETPWRYSLMNWGHDPLK